MREQLAKFYEAWGDLMSGWASLFTVWSANAYWKSSKLFYDEAVDFANSNTIRFTDQPETPGDPWSFKVGEVDEPILPLAHPIQPDGHGGWFYGVPPKGTFDNGTFDEPTQNAIDDLDTTPPHGEDSR